MKSITNEFEMIAPERMQILRKINKMIRIGSIKEFSIDEQIEMSGVMAEAAAAFYFSLRGSNACCRRYDKKSDP